MVGGRMFYGGWTHVLWWVDARFMVIGRTFLMMGGRTFYGGWMHVLWWVDAHFMVGGRIFFKAETQPLSKIFDGLYLTGAEIFTFEISLENHTNFEEKISVLSSLYIGLC